MSKPPSNSREIKRVPVLHKGEPLWESQFKITTNDPKKARIQRKQIFENASKKSQSPALVQKKVDEKNAYYKKHGIKRRMKNPYATTNTATATA